MCDSDVGEDTVGYKSLDTVGYTDTTSGGCSED